MKPRTLVYLTGESIRNLARNYWVSVGALLTITLCFLVVGVVSTLASNLALLARSVESQLKIVAFLDPTMDRTGLPRLSSSISDLPGVSQIRFISKEDALSKLRSELGTGVLDGLEGDNPLPDALEVTTVSALDIPQVAQKVKAYPGIVQLRYGDVELERLLSVTRVIRIVSLVLAVALGLVVIVIVGNTIRLAVFSRRHEIRIMKMVGATDFFIRWPFVIEGAILGLSGTGLALLGLWWVYRRGSEWAQGILPILPLLDSRVLMADLLPPLLLLGAMVGLIGSGMSVRRFLKA
ncbi:MAG: ABC transporter permease [Firmicutes bacterium]|nr:ABC transporter permease [Bacillota bacterium]